MSIVLFSLQSCSGRGLMTIKSQKSSFVRGNFVRFRLKDNVFRLSCLLPMADHVQISQSVLSVVMQINKY